MFRAIYFIMIAYIFKNLIAKYVFTNMNVRIRGVAMIIFLGGREKGKNNYEFSGIQEK